MSLFTPILYSSTALLYAKSNWWFNIQEWIFGYYNGYIQIRSQGGSPWFFEEFEPFPIHIIATTLIVISHFAILFIAAKKLKKKEHFASPSLIYFSIVTMLAVIGYVIYFWNYLVIPCVGTFCTRERGISPGFAVYGQFISGFFVFINYCLGKTKR